MPTKFSIIMTIFEPFHLLPRALSCVVQQEYEDWELLLMLDGPPPSDRFVPRRLAGQLRRQFPGKRIELYELPRAAGCYGNVGHNTGLEHAMGDYVCWVNHDNLITPQYLAAHLENIEKTPGCLSVVDIDLWKQDRYLGRYPRRFASSKIDLLCFAAPVETARQVDAFGVATRRIYAADWLTFNACRKLIPLEHNRRLVGTHF